MGGQKVLSYVMIWAGQKAMSWFSQVKKYETGPDKDTITYSQL